MPTLPATGASARTTWIGSIPTRTMSACARPKPVDRLVDDALRVVDDLLHGHSFPWLPDSGRPSPRLRAAPKRKPTPAVASGVRGSDALPHRPGNGLGATIPSRCSAEYRVTYSGRAAGFLVTQRKRTVDMDNLGRHSSSRSWSARRCSCCSAAAWSPTSSWRRRKATTAASSWSTSAGACGLRRCHRRGRVGAHINPAVTLGLAANILGKGGTEFLPGNPGRRRIDRHLYRRPAPRRHHRRRPRLARLQAALR